jgi:hypothetical protein
MVIPLSEHTPNHETAPSATTHYLKAVVALGEEKAKASGLDPINWMKANPSDDDCFSQASIRADGRFLTTGYLFRVKKPSQSKSAWDVFNVLSSTPADQAFRHVAEGGCSLPRRRIKWAKPGFAVYGHTSAARRRQPIELACFRRQPAWKFSKSLDTH